ncbi:MAG: hypothetical protein KDD37_01580 [Bdellovibrionales bacterium]|nr:hypothetical protein [Bdellovibrionales bacterium]
MKQIIISIFLLLNLIGCASRPKLYPNEKYKSVGPDVAKEDVNLCMQEADQYLENSTGKKALKGAGAGAAVGAAFGAATSLIFGGNPLRGAVQSGAVGAAVGGTAGALSPDQIKHRYVNQCLANKGYHVLGWD